MLRSPAYWEAKYKLGFISYLGKYMQDWGLTQSALAERLGVTKGHVSRLLHMEGNYRVDTLVKILHTLGYVLEFRVRKIDDIIAEEERTGASLIWGVTEEDMAAQPEPEAVEVRDASLPYREVAEQRPHMRLYRLIVPVRDIEAVAAFYADLFGAPGSRVSPGRHYFDLGGMILAFYDPSADGDEPGSSWAFHENQYLYIATPALDEIHRKLLDGGRGHVDVSVETMPWGERLFYFVDPFGNRLCFVDVDTVFTG